MTDFKVEPSSTAGGGHPSVTITQSFSYDNTTDSVKDAFVRLQPGLLGNPQSAAFCSQQQFESDSCPEDSTVGSVTIDALAYAIPMVGVPSTSHGSVYNMKPTGDEPARVGVVVDAAMGLQKLFLQAPVYVRPGPDGYGLESTFADQPRNAGRARADHEGRADLQREGQQGRLHAHAHHVRRGHLGEPGELLGGGRDELAARVQR